MHKNIEANMKAKIHGSFNALKVNYRLDPLQFN